MANMSAEFDEEAHNSLVCILRKPWRDILVATYNLFVIA